MILDAFFTASANTQGITVRVAPNFLEEQSDAAQGRWFWSYQMAHLEEQPPKLKKIFERLTEVILEHKPDRKSTRLNSSHRNTSRMPSSA